MQQVSLRDYCEQARSFIQAGEPHKAVNITRHILRQYPRHVESYRLLGQALLTAGNDQEAATQFRRVLSADPEDVSSRVGLAEIHQATGDLDKAIWYIQRAVELSPGNPDLRAQLRQLTHARQGDGTPETSELTRAALARIHARAGLHAKAVQEFTAVLEANPDRVDVQTGLAEALWGAGRHSEAVEACHRILEKLPNVLKAVLMVGAWWLEQEEPDQAEPYLGLAQALDPENLVAQSLFGELSPLPPLAVHIEPLGEDEIDEIESIHFGPPPTSPQESVLASQPHEPAIDWMSELQEEESTPMSDEERADEEFELPDWLKGVGDDLLPGDDDQPAATSPAEPDSVEGDETPSWLRDLVARAEEPDASDESVPAEPGDVPDWLQELRPEVPEEIPPDSEEPDWLASISEGRAPDDLQPDAEDEELPSWEQILAEEGIDLESVEEAPPPEAEGLTAEEWLRTTADLEGAPLAPEEPEPVAAEPSVEEPEAPAEPVAEAEGDEAGLPDWLREFEVADVAPEAEEPLEEPEPSLLEPLGDVVEDSDVPDWLREITAGEPVPSAEAQPPTEVEPPLEVEVEEAGLPDWLREYEEPAAEEEKAEAQPIAPEDVAEPMVTAEEGRALWEQMLAEEGVDLEPVEEVPSPDATGITADEWLRSTADLEEPPLAPQEPEPVAEEPSLGEPEAPPEPVAEIGEVGLPEWLEDAGELPEEEARLAAELAAKSYESDLPDWLRQIAAGEPISAEEGDLAEPAAEAEPLEEPTTDRVPELGEPAAELEEAPAEIEVEEPAEEVFDVEVDEAGLPDWLREPSTEAVEFPEPEAGPPSEVPEWLTELETEDMLLTESELEEPVELETGEMPEWLSEIMAGEPALTEEWAVEPAQAEAEEEQIPDWLREFREREAEAEAEPAVEAEELEAPAAVEEELEYEAPPELPEWLLQLRAGVPELEVPPPTEQPVEAEVEEILPETPIEVEAVPPGELLPELEAVQPEEVGPEWMQELVAAEEAPAEPELPEEEEILAAEVVEAEMPPAAPLEAEPELLVTRRLEALQVEDLPDDPGARLSLARTAFSAGDWSDALMIYQTMVNSSEMLDSVIENLEAGVRRHPDDPAGYQLLGDACMKDGRLGDALDAYRRALSRL